MTTSGGEGRPSVIDRVFCVLESCAASGRSLTLVDLSRRTGLPKTTVHRVCWKLVELGLLTHADDGFQVSPKLFALGSMSPELRRLRALAMPWLHELTARTEWATNLAVIADGRALVVEEVYGQHTGRMPRMVGARLPLHATAIGKALLSGFDDAELEDYLRSSALKAYTPNTIVRPNLLAEHLRRVRATGFAMSFEEWSLGTSGVAAPVYADGQVIAAVAVVGETNERSMQSHAQYARQVGAKLSQALSPASELCVA
jgi:IclR family transcriptional regulator, acetate operon repressor